MRSRNRSHVDTFPFLAVLLCAMGALILVLLVMDRRSKLAARARGRDQARRQVEMQARAVAARKKEHDSRRRAAQSAWDKKRDELRSRVTADQEKLDAELRQVQARLAEAAHRLRHEAETAQKLREQLKAEQSRQASQEQALTAARQEASDMAGKATAAEKARAALAADLQRLEQTLRELRAARERDAQTYSVIPYRGKRGDGRRPIYVECSAGGLIFHPDKAQIDAESPAAIRGEVERRMTAQREQLAKAGVSQPRAYLMLLVRPDGVQRYYQVQAAVRELPVDFGYELVDAEWKLHFPAEDAVTAVKPETGPSPEPETTHMTILPPLSAGAGSGSGEGGPLSAGAGRGSGEGGPSRRVELHRPLPGVEPGPVNSGPPAVALAPPSHPDAPLPGRQGPAPRSASGVLLPPIVESSPRAARLPSPAGPAAPAAPAAPPQAPAGGSGFGGNTGGSRREVPMRPARISGGGDVTIYVECQSDAVIVHPTRRRIALESLNHTDNYNPLYKTVKQMIYRRLQAARPGEPLPRVQVRFLVHPDAERTYHMAYPPLETLSVPKTRYSLQAEDDVARIVAGF